MRKSIPGLAAIFLLVISISCTSWTVIVPNQNLSSFISEKDSIYNLYVSNIYHQARLDSAGLSETVFEKAFTGSYNLKY